MYEAKKDPYCYPGTGVLKNVLDLRDQAKLEAFEAEITTQRAAELRTVRIAKGGNTFCYPENIDREMRRLFTALADRKYFQGLGADDFAAEAAHFLADLNAIHPFREGNGRTQLSFLMLLADQAGHPLQLERLDPKEILDAIIKSFGGNEAPLLAVLKRLVG